MPDDVGGGPLGYLIEVDRAADDGAGDAEAGSAIGRHGISSPIVGGAINLYQVGDWATAHVIRHNRQAKQVLGK